MNLVEMLIVAAAWDLLYRRRPWFTNEVKAACQIVFFEAP